MISHEFLFSIYKNALNPAIPSSLHGLFLVLYLSEFVSLLIPPELADWELCFGYCGQFIEREVLLSCLMGGFWCIAENDDSSMMPIIWSCQRQNKTASWCHIQTEISAVRFFVMLEWECVLFHCWCMSNSIVLFNCLVDSYI